MPVRSRADMPPGKAHTLLSPNLPLTEPSATKAQGTTGAPRYQRIGCGRHHVMPQTSGADFLPSLSAR